MMQPGPKFLGFIRCFGGFEDVSYMWVKTFIRYFGGLRTCHGDNWNCALSAVPHKTSWSSSLSCSRSRRSIFQSASYDVCPIFIQSIYRTRIVFLMRIETLFIISFWYWRVFSLNPLNLKCSWIWPYPLLVLKVGYWPWKMATWIGQRKIVSCIVRLMNNWASNASLLLAKLITSYKITSSCRADSLYDKCLHEKPANSSVKWEDIKGIYHWSKIF